MVKVDKSKWPMVFIEVDGLTTLASMEEYNREMEDLLDYADQQPEKFGMIYMTEMDDAEAKAGKRDKEAKKLSSRWLKANRSRFGGQCAGIAMVMPNAGTFMKMMRPIAKRSVQRMMGAPGDMFFSINEAEEWMKEQM